MRKIIVRKNFALFSMAWIFVKIGALITSLGTETLIRFAKFYLLVCHLKRMARSKWMVLYSTTDRYDFILECFLILAFLYHVRYHKPLEPITN